MNRWGRRVHAVVAVAALLLAACSSGSPAQPGAAKPADKAAPVAKVAGDANNGRQLFTSKGCIACHVAPGVPAATGTIGPSLAGIGDATKRPQLAAGTPNTPANLKLWVKDPAAAKPGTQMPNLGLSDKESDDLVAFLLTLR